MIHATPAESRQPGSQERSCTPGLPPGRTPSLWADLIHVIARSAATKQSQASGREIASLRSQLSTRWRCRTTLHSAWACSAPKETGPASVDTGPEFTRRCGPRLPVLLDYSDVIDAAWASRP